jgi:hypothetical protein
MSDSAAGAAGLKLHDYRSAGANQQSAAPGETAGGVANQELTPDQSSSATPAVSLA